MFDSSALAHRKPLDVTVVVVSFNTRELTLACLESVVRETKAGTYELIVFDNASTDSSSEAIGETFPNVRVISSSENVGFARANNLAANGLRSRYLLLLNPDTLVLDGAISRLVAFADEHQSGSIFGGRTLFADGSLNPTSCWREPTVWGSLCRALGISAVFSGSTWLNPSAYGGWSRDSVRAVDILSGCFMLVRRDVWEELNGFDSSYFMYGEDWDLCLRARRLGHSCLFCPTSEIIHYGGRSDSIRTDKLVRLLQTRTKLIRQHWTGWYRSALLFNLCIQVFRGVGMDSFRVIVRRAQPSAPWREVWNRRDEWL